MSDIGGSRNEAKQSFDAILGLGSNVGDREANIEEALRLLTADGAVTVAARSQLYRTAPWGVTNQDWFLNVCVGVLTGLDPHALLKHCQSVEREMGRVRKLRWGPRNIDVDILLMGEQKIDEPDLTIPHPRIAERAFVLVPLKDVAPNLIIGGASLDDLLVKLDSSDVEPYRP
ncbi:2-amino-4-hydroxy-6-hydroxymethyldihydropteridine diphosphokinase [Hyphomicrobium methylovorum]|uniref:2-amino-4-hydroxy-6- hydroxymethyldihydropteridine diphosphokinase n=1 Tax=Hyphomicrobium methylovorum TaxID=84 RepID=UPI0015E78135|nr:2-amino-4-hydroxy-6-hydroxymethyldihydropteridine diphosphokinase [Hyphomicrobium methylovorum]MBA2127723.1 2-amino-4-hydroxy-6-hydroxymethyldihydropteridine diphosphokinase [Hyphomicrobium methylovorum]